MNYNEYFIQGHHTKGFILNPTAIILHHINYSKEDVIKLFTQSKGTLSNGLEFKYRVSAHVYIQKNGERIVFGKDNQKLWHAGKSSFKGRKNCNSFALGVEFEGDTNKNPLTNHQIYSFIEWLIPRIEKHPINLDAITTHLRVAPERKIDISELEFKKIRESIKYLWV